MDSLEHIRGGIYQVLSAGYRPIIAHAERYESVCTKVEHVADLVAMGCYIQVNAGSVMGQYGMGIRQFIKRVMKRGLSILLQRTAMIKAGEVRRCWNVQDTWKGNLAGSIRTGCCVRIPHVS